jgi:hypothetical protein
LNRLAEKQKYKLARAFIYRKQKKDNRHMSDPTKTASASETFQNFVSAINSHNIEALTALMSDGHLFVDSLGNRVEGAARMQTGWRSYFTMCPDYWLRLDTVISEVGTFLAVGAAGGTIDAFPWRTPAAWKAIIHEGKVLEWHVFADNKPVYEILARRKP